MTTLSLIGLAWWLATILLLLGSTLATLLQARAARHRADDRVALPPVSIIVPLKHASPTLDVATRSIFMQDYPTFDLILAASEAKSDAIDTAVAVARAQRRRPFALVKTEAAGDGDNPKIANLLQPYATARYDTILLKDANTILPEGHLRAMTALLDDEVALVASAPILRGPSNFPAFIECAIVNALGARMLGLAERLGIGVGLGAAMLVRRPDLDAAGGLASVRTRLADDHAIARALAVIGRQTRLTPTPVEQIVGARTLQAVADRHTRWATCRKSEEPLAFIAEPFTGGIAAVIAAALAAPGLGLAEPIAMLVAAGLVVTVETALCAARGWPSGWRLAIAIPCREAMLAVIWWRALLTPSRRWLERPQ